MSCFLYFFFLCLSVNQIGASPKTTDSALHYNFTYNFQMDMHGKILFFIPYRFFYEASASVNFLSKINRNGMYKFFFNGIERTGYVMTTGGLRGNSLYFFTADYSMENSIQFREKKINSFKKSNPYYAKNIKKIRRRPMIILSKNPEAVYFERDKNGIHHRVDVNMQLTDSHSFTYANIYKIMGEWMLAYDHSFLPEGGIEVLTGYPDRLWYSSHINFSNVLKAVAKLTSKSAEKRTKFKQKETFQLLYQITSSNDRFVEISGEGFPNIRILRKMRILQISRKVKLRLIDSVVMEDRIFLNFRDQKGRGGTVHLKLYLQ